MRSCLIRICLAVVAFIALCFWAIYSISEDYFTPTNQWEEQTGFTIYNGELGFYQRCTDSDELIVSPRPFANYSDEVKIPTRIKLCGKDYTICAFIKFDTFSENVTAFRMEDDNPYYATVDGIIYSKDMKQLVVCPKGKKGKVEIPEGVEEIASRAFFECSQITEIIIPNTVQKIYGQAFDLMGNLTELHIPASVTTLETREPAISRCPKLKKITVSEDNPVFTSVDGNLYSKDKTLLVGVAKVKKGDISIPEGVKSIVPYLFVQDSNIKTVTIPSTVKELDGAFYRCENLTTVTFAQGADTITLGPKAFSNCKNLTRVVIPASVKKIADLWNCFEKYPNLRFEVDKGNTTYESKDGKLYRKDTKEQLFEYKPLEPQPTYDTPLYDTISYHNDSTLALIELIRLKYYPKNAKGEFTIPSDVKAISKYAFWDCKGLTSLTIGKSVGVINVVCPHFHPINNDYYSPFLGCDNLVSVTIKKKTPPSSDNLFTQCSVIEDYEKDAEPEPATYYLVEGTSKAYVVRNGGFDYPFYGVNENLTIYIPQGSREIYEALWGKHNFVEIDMPDAGD